MRNKACPRRYQKGNPSCSIGCAAASETSITASALSAPTFIGRNGTYASTVCAIPQTWDRRKFAPSCPTYSQALSALLFLYKEVLGIELLWIEGISRPKRPPKRPTVLTQIEVKLVLDHIDRTTCRHGSAPIPARLPENAVMSVLLVRRVSHRRRTDILPAYRWPATTPAEPHGCYRLVGRNAV